MIFFKYHGGYETGKNLLEALKENSPLIKRVRGLMKISPSDILVRWGDSSDSEIDSKFLNKGAKVFNSSSSILKNTNKLKCFSLFKNAGLNVPNIYLKRDKIKRFPVLGRDSHHHGGLDIVMIHGSNSGKNDFSKIPIKDFYVELLESRMEYRVHVFDNEVIRVTKKVFRGHDKDGNSVESKDVIKNDTYGWGHKNIELDEIDPNYLEVSKKALKAIGLSFGAVDLLIERGTNKPFVLEVNSSPRLNTIGLGIYVDKIVSLINPPKKTHGVFIKW